MSPHKEEKLFNEFPELFRGRLLPLVSNLMAFGFEWQDGWFELVYKLCSNISAHASKHGLQPLAVQVKEKYGTLSVSVQGADRHILDLIYVAEHASQRICEVCGATGQLRERTGWLMARCTEHAREDT